MLLTNKYILLSSSISIIIPKFSPKIPVVSSLSLTTRYNLKQNTNIQRPCHYQSQYYYHHYFSNHKYNRSRTTMSANNNDHNNHDSKYAPSQYVIDTETGEKYRLCAAAAVLNSKNELLVGERIGIPNSWQCPQGGVDDTWIVSDNAGGTIKKRDKESITEAACRELYEEMGLQNNKHVMIIPLQNDGKNGNEQNKYSIRYKTAGSGGWLHKNGFVGQELHWTIFKCIDAHGDLNPSSICDLSGKNGEHAEFSSVQWQPITHVLSNIWEKKRGPYEALQKILVGDDNDSQNVLTKWMNQVFSIDFTGTWSRNNDLCTNVIPALEGRGLSVEEATDEATKPYIQSWRRKSNNHNADDSMNWIVTTFQVDGITPRRELEYKVGEWEERYKGKAILFGPSSNQVDGDVLKRRTLYVAEPDASPIPIAHVTITDGPKGVEEARRYMKGESVMILRRTLLSDHEPEHPIVCTEIFEKVQQ